MEAEAQGEAIETTAITTNEELVIEDMAITEISQEIAEMILTEQVAAEKGQDRMREEPDQMIDINPIEVAEERRRQVDSAMLQVCLR